MAFGWSESRRTRRAARGKNATPMNWGWQTALHLAADSRFGPCILQIHSALERAPSIDASLFSIGIRDPEIERMVMETEGRIRCLADAGLPELRNG